MTPSAADDRTEVGSYFVANYPPFSVWTADADSITYAVTVSTVRSDIFQATKCAGQQSRLQRCHPRPLRECAE